MQRQQSYGFQKTLYVPAFRPLPTCCYTSLQQQTAYEHPKNMYNPSQYSGTYNAHTSRGSVYQPMQPPIMMHRQHMPPIQQPLFVQQSPYIHPQNLRAANETYINHAYGNAPHYMPAQGQRYINAPPGYSVYPQGRVRVNRHQPPAPQYFRPPPMYQPQQSVGGYGNFPNTGENCSGPLLDGQGLEQQTRVVFEAMKLLNLSDGNHHQSSTYSKWQQKMPNTDVQGHHVYTNGLQDFKHPCNFDDRGNSYNTASEKSQSKSKPKSETFVVDCDETKIPDYKLKQRMEKKIKKMMQRQKSLKDDKNLENSSSPKTLRQAGALSNRVLIVNAVEYVLFPGAVHKALKNIVLDKIASSQSKRFLVLFRDESCQFRALYNYDSELNKISKLYGSGPATVDEQMFEKFFKYISHTKRFGQVYTNELTATIDAFTIHNSLWQFQNGHMKKKKKRASKKDVTSAN